MLKSRQKTTGIVVSPEADAVKAPSVSSADWRRGKEKIKEKFNVK